MISDDPDYILELSSLPAEPPDAGAAAQEASTRKWIGVRFTCCDVYTRVWRNREGTAYVGYCPRCRRKVSAKVGPGGVSSRFFEAG